MHKTMKTSALLWVLLLSVGGAEAAGLGKLSVQSALGQPLRAEIELLSLNKDELAGVSVRLAGAEAFRQARIDRIAALTGLRFSVEQHANGQPVIRISSSVPIADPFLDMLIEVGWNSGRLLREYTILLDPPSEAKPAPVVVAPPLVAEPVAPERREVVENPRVRAPEPASANPPGRYGPVKYGETLRGIADKVTPEGVTPEQMMVGLYQGNRDAFFAANMNRLKRGQVLDVPTAEGVHLQVSPAQASRIVQSQSAQWHAYRRKIAEMATETPAAKAPASGKLAPSGEEQEVPASPVSRDVLKLSKGEPGSGRANARTQEKLQALEEEVAAKGRALQEAQDRVGQLERTVRDMQKLLELRAQEAAKAPPAVKPAVPVPQPAVPQPAPVAKPVAAPAAAPVIKAKPAPVVLPTPVPAPSSSWVSTFLASPLYVGGIAAALLLSVLLWMMMVGSRRRHGLNKFEDSIMTGGEFKNNAVFNAAAPSPAGASTEGSMLLTDFSRLGLGAIDTHEVDPIAEAEVYMAYGRDAQAEEILREALGKDPGRHEIALKLLEIYAARKDVVTFETVASELYAGLGGQGTPVWQRAAEMGRSIDASNPLYRANEIPDAVKANARPAAAPQEAFSPDVVDDWDAMALTPEQGDDFEITDAASPALGSEPTELISVAPSPEEAAFTASLPAQEFALEFEPAEALASLPADLVPLPEAPGWESSPGSTHGEVVVEPEAAPVVETESAAPAWQEPVEELEFEATPVFDEASESTPARAAAPMLDLSGIDLEFDMVEPESLDEELDLPAPEIKLPRVETPTKALPEPDEEEFIPDVLEEFKPLAKTEAAAPEIPEAAAPAEVLPELEEEEFIPDLLEEFKPLAEVVAAAAEIPDAVPEAAPLDPELWEEVNTKLDLARAYLEMGDQEGAREILEEVLGEGDVKQKADAGKLLAEAG